MNDLAFHKIFNTTNTIALATSINDTPNVRIVNFCYNKQQPHVLYFTSDRENQKVKEFSRNHRIAFTTIPFDKESIAHARSNQATIQRSNKNLAEVQNLFIEKIPGYGNTIESIGSCLDVFEIHIKQVSIILNYDHFITINFNL